MSGETTISLGLSCILQTESTWAPCKCWRLYRFPVRDSKLWWHIR